MLASLIDPKDFNNSFEDVHYDVAGFTSHTIKSYNCRHTNKEGVIGCLVTQVTNLSIFQ